MSDTHRQKTSFILGIDLGKAQDPTALCGLEVSRHDTGRRKVRRDLVHMGHSYSVFDPRRERTIEAPLEVVYENHYAARHLERLPLGTPYPEQVRYIAELYLRLQARGYEVTLAADRTGVGDAVLDLLIGAELPVIGVYIHSGNKVTREGRSYNVPKLALVSAVEVLLQTKRLIIDANLPEAAILTKELQGFNYEISKSGHVSFGNDVGSPLWREAQHDDMVLGTAVAAWYGENRPTPSPPPPPSRVFNMAR